MEARPGVSLVRGHGYRDSQVLKNSYPNTRHYTDTPFGEGNGLSSLAKIQYGVSSGGQKLLPMCYVVEKSHSSVRTGRSDFNVEDGSLCVHVTTKLNALH